MTAHNLKNNKDFNSINKDTMPLDTREGHEYDNIESSSCHSGLRAGIQRNDNLMPKAFRFAQSGRSIVEMLGVLAIIGVLSIGGIMGYSYSMDKYRANEIINDVDMRMIDIARQVFRNQSEIAIPEDWDIKGRSGYVIDVFQNTDSEPSIMVERVPSSVCKMVLQNTSDTQDIYVGILNGNQVDGNWYLGDNEDICDGSDKEMLFAMSPEILAGFNPDSEDYVEPEGTATAPVVTKLECYSNTDCRPDKPYCSDNGACVKCPNETPIWNGNTCEACPSETPYWNSAYQMCSACLNDTHCNLDTPYCKTDTGTCVACLNDIHCAGQDIPLCNTSTNVCECPTNKPYYDADINYCGDCKTHSDCSQFGDNYLCLNANEMLTDSSLCAKNPGYNTCRSYTISKTVTIDGKEWVYVGVRTHWDAEKICQALGKSLPTVEELVTESDGSKWNGSVAVSRTRTELAKKLQAAFNVEWIWTPTRYSWTSCGAVYVSIVSGWVGGNSKFTRSNTGWTLCR